MKKEYMFTIACVTIALIGLWVLLKSPSLGNDAVSQFLRVEMGGSGATSSLNILLEQYIAAYRLAGGILLGGGFFGTIISLFKIIF
ncbi:MAG: hypothetical protein M1609_14315 [Firmicutes bacterium]|nr:hypothetical protein [Bacillota bacterium]